MIKLLTIRDPLKRDIPKGEQQKMSANSGFTNNHRSPYMHDTHQIFPDSHARCFSSAKLSRREVTNTEPACYRSDTQRVGMREGICSHTQTNTHTRTKHQDPPPHTHASGIINVALIACADQMAGACANLKCTTQPHDYHMTCTQWHYLHVCVWINLQRGLNFPLRTHTTLTGREDFVITIKSTWAQRKNVGSGPRETMKGCCFFFPPLPEATKCTINIFLSSWWHLEVMQWNKSV